jgi:hypothetical protein
MQSREESDGTTVATRRFVAACCAYAARRFNIALNEITKQFGWLQAGATKDS